MDPLYVLLLLGAGLAGGFLAGLVGVGGGIIYGPVLLYYYRAIGLEDPLLTPLTLGTSLLCVAAAALSGALAQRGFAAIDWRAAVAGGLAASAATVLTALLLTTQPWYDRIVFQLVLGTVLVWVVFRMLWPGRASARRQAASHPEQRRHGLLVLGGIGAGTGVLVAAAGVGGGILFVPLYSGILGLPLKRAMATSLAAILIVSIAGVATYVVAGLGAVTPIGALGYVHFVDGLLLGIPAIATARLGVLTARRVNVRVVRRVFAALAGVIALQLIGESVGLW